MKSAITILITSARGTIGSEIIKYLLALNMISTNLHIRAAIHSVNGGSISSTSISKDLKNMEIQTLIVMDYSKLETIVEGLMNVNKLFILTPTHPKMVDFTLNLVNGAKKNGVKHIVKLSYIRADADQDKISIT
jgi:uncharacterized protein YbjT (DUF2867 family)